MALYDIVFEAQGLTREKRKEVYWSGRVGEEQIRQGKECVKEFEIVVLL